MLERLQAPYAKPRHRARWASTLTVSSAILPSWSRSEPVAFKPRPQGYNSRDNSAGGPRR